MRYLLPMVIYLGLTAYVIADIAQHRDEEPYRMPKVVWVLIVLFAPYVGAGAWILAKWMNRGGAPGAERQTRYRSPDDDPDYLMWLNEQERRRRQQGGRD